MPASLYHDKSYASWRDPSYRSARAVVPVLLGLVRPESVVDVGCGLGMWAAVFGEQGLTDVHGVDGEGVPSEALMIPPENFRVADLSQPLAPQRDFGLAVCLEVAEHLPAAAAGALVETLCGLAPVVLFSAAIPHQRGRHHVNEQWPEYWARLFAGRGWRTVDCMRRRIWDDEEVEPYYKQNMLVYVDGARIADYPALAAEALPAGETPLSLVHPHYYLKRTDFARTSVKWAAMRASHYLFAALRRLGLSSGRQA